MFTAEMILITGLGIVMLFLIAWIISGFYQKCGPNQAMLVFGFGAEREGRRFAIVKGGGAIVLPVIQERKFLSLEVMTIEVRSQAPIITKSGIPMFVEGVAQVKVKGDHDSIEIAAEQFLGKTDDEVATIAHETLVGHLRAILGTMEVEQLIQNFDAFAAKVQEVSIADLAKMGLTVVSFTIKEIKDNVGYLEALGRKRSADVRRDADIGVAHASKETQIQQALAQRDAQIAQAQAAQEGAQAKLAADTQVAEAQKKFQVSQAQYNAEVAAQKAASDLAYDIVKAQQEQRLIQETQQIKIVETQKLVELQQIEVQRQQVALEATVTKPAEAEQSRIQIIAQANAQAAKLQAQGNADATKLRALAEAEATKLAGLAQAEANKAQGMAEAQVIQAKGQAEAEAMLKKAESFKQYNQAAMSQMVIDKLPDLVGAAAAPISKIGQMTVLATGGDGAGASKITSDVISVAAQSLSMIKGLTGFDLTQAVRQDKENGHDPEQKQK